MSGITFPSWTDDGPVELLEILELLGDRGRQATWRLRSLEVAPSDAAQQLHAHSDREDDITGDELLRLADRKPQLIDGVLEAWLPDADAPWVVIRAIDSTSWDLLSEDAQVLDEARTRFHATPLPQ
jgi:hypothetical protein